MKLLLYTAENEVDHVLMLVPDDYDEDQADTEANNFVPGSTLALVVELDELPDKWLIGEYRPYIG